MAPNDKIEQNQPGYDTSKMAVKPSDLRAQSKRVQKTEFKTPWRFRNPAMNANRLFLNDISYFQFELTDASKQLYEQGKPDQGYIGMLEFDPSGRCLIHLIPAFNAPAELVCELDEQGNVVMIINTNLCTKRTPMN